MLPGERARLHERTARALAAAEDEDAGRGGGRALAGRPGTPAEELPARVAAAGQLSRYSVTTRRQRSGSGP